MILSASRRTDIPAFYFEWFLNRLDEGYALIPNPYNAGRLGRVTLSPDVVDVIVFWTKNPTPMLRHIARLDEMGYRYYVQFTLTPYDKTLEPNLPPKPELIQAFIELSQKTSAKQIVWRYDPVVIDEAHGVSWHIDQFADLCGKLGDFTERCVISFVDAYKGMRGRFRAVSPDDMNKIASGFSRVAALRGVQLFTCAEAVDLSAYNIRHAACIDQALIEQIIHAPIAAKRDANQRPMCHCIASVDIGAYDTCPHACAYCYATTSPKAVARRVGAHDPKAPMLTGHPAGTEIITDRTTPSQRIDQLGMF